MVGAHCRVLQADLRGLMHVSEGLLGFFDIEPTKLSRLNRQ